jgi:glutamate synthase (NADPH/NADH) large chain
LDLNPDLVNTEMVDILPVPKDRVSELHALLSKFFAETGSEIAHELLKDVDSSVKRFSLVMPRDYARVLSVIERAERDGRSADEAIMEVLNG